MDKVDPVVVLSEGLLEVDKADRRIGLEQIFLVWLDKAYGYKWSIFCQRL